jgi:hypothetical protein
MGIIIDKLTIHYKIANKYKISIQKLLMKLYLGLFGLILMLSLTNAWTQDTSIYVAKQVLIERYPACALQIEQGVKEVYRTEVVDEFLGEPLNFHCDTMICLPFSPLYCNTQYKTCPSEAKAGNVKSEAQRLCDCEQAKGLAKSITYFIAKYNPMNVMVNESTYCREGFNNMVEENMKKEEWSAEFQCDRPNMKFSFDSRRFNEVIINARTFALSSAFSGTSPWFCYTLETQENGNGGSRLKKDGELCISNVECESDYCNNRVCCSGGICCPNVGIKGHPCLQGQICNENYVCEYLQYSNGEKCEYNEECYSGNCAYNMLNNQAYCTYPGAMYGCISDEDCSINYDCVDYSCKYVPKEKEEKENGKEEIVNGNGMCLILPLILLGGLFAWKKKLN